MAVHWISQKRVQTIDLVSWIASRRRRRRRRHRRIAFFRDEKVPSD